MYAFNAPPKSFVLVYTHVNLNQSSHDAGGVLENIIIKTYL